MSLLFYPFSQNLWKRVPFFSFDLTSSSSSFANAQIEWKGTPEAHIFKADLRGAEEKVKIKVEEGKVLLVSVERNVEKEDKNDKWHHVERSRGKFIRSFRLPENSKLDYVKASMANGVLTVTEPLALVVKAIIY